MQHDRQSYDSMIFPYHFMKPGKNVFVEDGDVQTYELVRVSRFVEFSPDVYLEFLQKMAQKVRSELKQNKRLNDLEVQLLFLPWHYFEGLCDSTNPLQDFFLRNIHAYSQRAQEEIKKNPLYVRIQCGRFPVEYIDGKLATISKDASKTEVATLAEKLFQDYQEPTPRLGFQWNFNLKVLQGELAPRKKVLQDILYNKARTEHYSVNGIADKRTLFQAAELGYEQIVTWKKIMDLRDLTEAIATEVAFLSVKEFSREINRLTAHMFTGHSVAAISSGLDGEDDEQKYPQ